MFEGVAVVSAVLCRHFWIPDVSQKALLTGKRELGVAILAVVATSGGGT